MHRMTKFLSVMKISHISLKAFIINVVYNIHYFINLVNYYIYNNCIKSNFLVSGVKFRIIWWRLKIFFLSSNFYQIPFVKDLSVSLNN